MWWSSKYRLQTPGGVEEGTSQTGGDFLVVIIALMMRASLLNEGTEERMRGIHVAVIALFWVGFWWMVVEFSALEPDDILWIIPTQIVLFLVMMLAMRPQFEAAEAEELRRKADEEDKLAEAEQQRWDEATKREDAEAALAELRERVELAATIFASEKADAEIDWRQDDLRSQGLSASQISSIRDRLFNESLRRHRAVLGLKPGLPR